MESGWMARLLGMSRSSLMRCRRLPTWGAPSASQAKGGVSGALKDGRRRRQRRNVALKLAGNISKRQSLAYLINHASRLTQDMPTPHLHGLALTKAERIIVVALSYIFCAPLLWANTKRLLSYVLATSAEAREQIREEEREERRRRLYNGLQ